jgi:hypothetical protein
MSKFPSLTIASVIAALLPAMANAQDQNRLYKEVKGWAIHQHSTSESSPNPSCSAVRFMGRSDAMRVERFDQGYFYGVNGLSRKEQGQLYDLSFWFDGDQSTRQGGQASFGRDAAYPHDDWLSFFHPYEERDTLVAAIANRRTLSFAFLVPGNRTGNDEVTTDFDLSGSAAALLALEECYQVASGAVQPTIQSPQIGVAPGSPSDCPDDGPRLPGSGICQGRGVNYLNIVGGSEPGLLDNCSWKLNEAAMPGGDYLLYMAASCGAHTTQLEFSAGARSAKVNVVRSGLGEGAPGGAPITVFTIDKASPENSILAIVQNAMEDKAEAAGCEVTGQGPDSGYPSDALQVANGAVAAEQAKTEYGSMDGTCGPLGDWGDTTTYWRVLGDYGWYFELGQDWYQDFDPRTFTIVKAADLPGN